MYLSFLLYSTSQKKLTIFKKFKFAICTINFTINKAIFGKNKSINRVLVTVTLDLSLFCGAKAPLPKSFTRGLMNITCFTILVKAYISIELKNTC